MSSNTTSTLSFGQYQSNSYSQQSSTEKEWYWTNPHCPMKPCSNLRHVGRRNLDKIDLAVDSKESVSFAKKHTLFLVRNSRLPSQLGNKAIRDAQKVSQHAFGCPSKVIRDPTITSAIVTNHHACSCVMPGCSEVGKLSAYKDRRIPNVDSDRDGCVRFNGKNNLPRSFSSTAAREVREINNPLAFPQALERSCTIRVKRLILSKYPNKYCHLRSAQPKFSLPAKVQSAEVQYESLCLSNPCSTTEQTLSQPNKPVLLQFKQKIEQLTAKSDRDHPNITHTNNNTNLNSNKHFLSSATSLNEMESRSPAQVKSFFADHLLLPKVEPIDYGDDDEQRPKDHYNGDDGNNQTPLTIFDEDPRTMPKQPTRIQKNIPNDGIMIPKYSLVVSFSRNQQQGVDNVPISSMNSHDDMNTIDHQSNNQSNDNNNNNHNSNNQNVDPHHNNHGESGGSNSNDNRDNNNSNSSNNNNNNSNDDQGKANDQNNNSSNNDGKDEGNNDEEEGDDRAGEDEEDDAISGGAEDDDSAGSDHNHQSDGISGGSRSSNSKKRKRKRFNEACTECRRAHKACSRTRPCERCVRLGTPEKCQSMERKKRKVTKKRWFNYQVQENGKITLENTKQQQQQQQQQRQKAMQSSFASSSVSSSLSQKNESASSSVSNIVHGSTMNTNMNSSLGLSQSFSPPVYQTPSATTAHQQQYQQSRTIVTNQSHGVNYQNHQQQQQYHPSFSMQHQEQQQALRFHQHHSQPSPYMATTGATSGLSQRATDSHTQQQHLHYYHHPPHQKQNNNSSNNQQFQQHQNKNIHGIMSTANTNTSTPSIMNQQHLGGSTGSQMSDNSNHLLVPSTTHHQISHTTAAIDSKQPDMMIPRSASSSSLFEPSLLHQQQHLPYHQHSQQVQQSIDGSQMALPSFNRLSNHPASGVGGSSMGRVPGHNNNHSAVVSSSSWHPNSSPSYDVLASPSPHQQEQRSDHALVVMDHRLRQQQHHTGHLMNMSMTPSPSSFVHQHTQQTHQFHSYQPSNVSGLITGANSSGRGGVNTARIFHGATFGEEVSSGFESVNPSSSTSTSSLHPSTTSSEAHSQQ